MSVTRIFIISALVIGSLGFVGHSVFAQRVTPRVSGWGNPQLAHVGPGGQSVLPVREVVLRNNALMLQEIREARENDEPVGPVVQLAVARLLSELHNLLGI